MYIVPLAWLYVALMMAVAEATSSNGTVLGAIITFVLYGALPIGLVVYVMSAPARRRAIKEREQAEWLAQQTAAGASPAAATPADSGTANASGTRPALEPDAGGKTPADAVAPVRKEP